MGNDIFNDEQLKYAEIVQKETEDALGWWKERALKAEAKLADKYLIEEQYETACGDRDGLLRMVETLREQKNALLAERNLALETATRERDAARRTVISRDEWRRHAEEQLADVLRLRFLGIEFASQYGDRALACKYDNSCDDSGREPECIPCAFRRALGLMGVN